MGLSACPSPSLCLTIVAFHLSGLTVAAAYRCLHSSLSSVCVHQIMSVAMLWVSSFRTARRSRRVEIDFNQTLTVTSHCDLVQIAPFDQGVQGKAKGCFPSELPRDISVLVTHGPPQRILQNKKKTAGCPELTALLDKASAPAVHVCGHLHRAHGVYTHRAPSASASTVVVNASSVSGALSPVNPPIVFDICST